MSNPFAARVSRTTAPESTSQLDQFATRLHALGASDDEIATVRDTWNDLSPEWTVEQRTALTVLGDDALRAELAATRDEYLHDTRTEAEQGHADATTHAARVDREAADIVGRPVASVLGWVGQDAIRAIAILDLELGPDGAGRKTLSTALQALLDPGDPEPIVVAVAG